MTLKEVVAVLKTEKQCVERQICDRDCAQCNLVLPTEEVLEAYEVAIKALEQEPCDDVISRQAAIDAIYACYIGGKEAVDKAQANDQYAEGIDEAVCAVEQLPPAEPDKRLEKIADLVEGTIDHFDRDDAMDLLYQIKEVLNER